MIPLRDDNPTELKPVVTVTFILLNLAIWIWIQGAGAVDVVNASATMFGTRPCELTGGCEVEGLSWSTLITAMFMHGSWEHLLGNLLFLWVFGNNIEDSMGHLRFIVFYTFCGLAAGLAHVFMGPASLLPAVGASGAISGIMGAYIVLYPHARVQTWIPPLFLVNIRAMFFLAYWLVLQLVMASQTFGAAGEEGGVAVWAHVGGFVAGVALIKLFEDPRLVEARKRHIKLTPEEVARMGGGW